MVATITVNAINDVPVIAAVEGTALVYTENDAATAITTTITASDVDNTNLTSATIQITGNYQNGEEVLSFTNTANITGSWNDQGTFTSAATTRRRITRRRCCRVRQTPPTTPA